MLLALAAEGLFNCLLNFFDRVVLRKDVRDRKKTGLHDCAGTPTEPRFLGNLVSVDHVKLELLFDDVALHFTRQLIPDFIHPRGQCSAEMLHHPQQTPAHSAC